MVVPATAASHHGHHPPGHGAVIAPPPAAVHLWVTPPNADTKIACTSLCNTVICLTYDSGQCITAQDVEGVIGSIGTITSTAWIIYQVITNRKGQSTDKGKDTEGGSEKFEGLCLAAAPNTSDGNDRVYETSNCFGNKYASWTCIDRTKTSCHYESWAARDEHRNYVLTELNTRNGAFNYVKPNNTKGTWQRWSWFKA